MKVIKVFKNMYAVLLISVLVSVSLTVRCMDDNFGGSNDGAKSNNWFDNMQSGFLNSIKEQLDSVLPADAKGQRNFNKAKSLEKIEASKMDPKDKKKLKDYITEYGDMLEHLKSGKLTFFDYGKIATLSTNPNTVGEIVQLLKKLEEAEVQGLKDVVGKWQEVGNQLLGVKKPYTMAQKVAIAGGSFVVIAGGVYFSKDIFELLKKAFSVKHWGFILSQFGQGKLIYSPLITETSLQYWFEKKKSPELLENLVFEPLVKNNIDVISENYKSIDLQVDTIPHYIFSGQAGLGKATAARAIAAQAGIDFAVMNGKVVAKSSDVISQLKTIYTSAQLTKKGLIVFVDQADLFLQNGNNKNQKKLDAIQEYFLELMDVESKKISFIFGVTSLKGLSNDFLKQIGEKNMVAFSVPAAEQSTLLVSKFIERYFKPAHAEMFDVKTIGLIVEKIRGFTVAEIAYFIGSLVQKNICGTDGINNDRLLRCIDRALKPVVKK